MTTVIAALLFLMVIVFLTRVFDGGRWNAWATGAARINATAELLAPPDEEAHRHLQVVHLQQAESGVEQQTTPSIALDDSPWFVVHPRPVDDWSINPAVLATITMLGGSELPAGFRFVAPGIMLPPTTPTL